MRARLAQVLILIGAGVAAGSLAGARFDDARSGDAVAATFASPAVTPQTAAAPPDSVQRQIGEGRRTAIVAAAERVAPAVVSVSVVRRQAVRPMSLWESLFLPPGTERTLAGFGSGIVIDPAGLVLTNEHVVRGADAVVVTLADGRQLEAEIVGTDEMNDLALLRIAGGELAAAPLGSSDDLLIGEWVVALGNPLGYVLSNTEPTVTAGVVSGVRRHITPGEGDRGYYLDMIQTDAAINPGNSGGPLVNAMGQVVGVNSSIISRSGGSEGLGFAIPIDRARRVAEDLLTHGRVRRAWVGMELEARPGEAGRGVVRVARVAPGSPAQRAGLRAGMALISADGRAVRSPWDWEALLLVARVGDAIPLVIEDERRQRTLSLVPSDLPSLTAERIRALEDFELVTLTPAIRAERGLRSERGALIVEISSQAARDLGLTEGDLIVQVNRQPVESAEETAQLLRRLAGQGTVRLFFERRGQLGSTSFYITG